MRCYGGRKYKKSNLRARCTVRACIWCAVGLIFHFFLSRSLTVPRTPSNIVAPPPRTPHDAHVFAPPHRIKLISSGFVAAQYKQQLELAAMERDFPAPRPKVRSSSRVRRSPLPVAQLLQLIQYHFLRALTR